MQDEYDANAQTLKTQHNKWSRQWEKQQYKWNAGTKKILKVKNIVNLIGGKPQISTESVLKN